jgi:phosphoglycerate dehydrogenase-like enzyme
MNAPRAMIALDSDSLLAELFDAESMARLHRLVRLDDIPITRSSPAIPAHAAEAEILITGWGTPRFDEEMLSSWPRLRAIVHAAGSVKRVVSPALWDRGIRVSSGATANALPVAEYTLAMILLSAKDALGSARRFGVSQDMVAARPAGRIGAFGITVGVVGASRIGRRVLELIAPFDVRTLLYDPSISKLDAARLGAVLVTLPELLDASDIVTLHAPSLPETYRMIGAAELARMRTGATLINTARGSLVDTEALVAELTAGRLQAVLDVTDPEPLPAAHPLFSAAGVTLTPHIAGSLGNELNRIGRQVVDEVESFVTTGRLQYEVTRLELGQIA